MITSFLHIQIETLTQTPCPAWQHFDSQVLKPDHKHYVIPL